ncbi:EAL domain-containing protein [bacterium]|nr:EAL domain-containing protein [bacterium]MBU1993972.1 EAL domain-containing protein [bacterium]
MNKIINASDIMNTHIVCIEPEAPLQRVALKMQNNSISSILICQDNLPMGIITQRDMLNFILHQEEGTCGETARDIMSSPLHSLNTNTDYKDVYAYMLEHTIRHLLIVDKNGTAAGVITESDFLQHLSPEQLLAIKEISNVMTTNAFTCSSEESVKFAFDIMKKNRIESLIIEKDSKPVGIISESDSLKLIQQGSDILHQPIKNFMSTPVISIHYRQTVINAQTIMAENQIRRIVVVDNEGKIKGMATRHDLIKNIPDYYVELLHDMLKHQKKVITKTQKKLDEKLIFENAVFSLPHAVIFVTDREGMIQFVNIKHNNLSTPLELQEGDDVTSLTHPLFSLFEESSWKEKVEKEKTLTQILKLPSTIGENNSYFETSISGIYANKELADGYIFIARDISSTQKMQDELRHIGEKLNDAYKAANIGNWELDAKTLEAFWSDEVCDIFGIERETLGSPRFLSNLVRPEDFAVIEKSLMSAIKKGTKHHMVYEIHRPSDNQTRWVECRANRELDENGNPKSLIGTIQDVSTREKSEKNIIHLNDLLKSIRNISQLMIKESKQETLLQKICDEIVHVSHFHGAWVLLHGNDTQEFYSAGFTDAQVSEVKNNLQKNIIPHCCLLEDNFLSIHENQSEDCRSCPLALNDESKIAITSPLLYNNIRFGHFGLAVPSQIIDNDEHRQLIKELANDISFSLFNIYKNSSYEKTQRRYRSLIENSNDCIYIHTLEGIIIDVNPALEKLHGISREHLIGQNIKNFYKPQQLEMANLHFAEIQKTGHISFEMELLKMDGTPFNAELVANLVELDGENVIQGSLRDVTKRYEAENKARESENSMVMALEGAGHGMWDWNYQTGKTFFSHQYKAMLGYKDDELSDDYDSWLHLLHPQDRQNTLNILSEFLKNKEQTLSVVFRMYCKNGSYKWILSKGNIVSYDNNSQPLRIIGTHTDITEQKKVENALQENERLLRQSATVFENTSEGVIISNAHNIIIDVNDAFYTITGRTKEEVIGKNPSILQSQRHDKTFYQAMWESIQLKGQWSGEIWNRRKNGEIYPEWLNISSVKNKLGEIESYIGVFSDITTLKESENKLDFMAHHDYLTELPNRVLLKARLEHTLNVSKRNHSLTAVMFMDLDNFKNINDSFGHTVGDDLLVCVSKRILTIIREDDTLARIGGDEFVIVMNNFKSMDDVNRIVQKIIYLFTQPFKINNKDFWTTASIGISISPDDGQTPEILIKNADTAMYEAKGDGKNIFKYYNDKMSAQSFERVLFENALKTAVANNEFEVYYQPQENLQTDALVGFEALVRWKHPTLGMIAPDKFIPIAEETKMILQIGEFVLEKACHDIAKWNKEGLCKGRVAVNVSGIQIEHSDFADILKSCLHRHRIDSSKLEIEVTESIVMKTPELWINLLQEIKRIGVDISIDDFGTGYSSLSYLRRLPVDTLKIDISFVQDLPHEKDACAIANAIIAMAKSLGLTTLAEGVETQEQRDYLKKVGCNLAQGFLLSRPMHSEDTYNWLVQYKKKGAMPDVV